MRCSSYGLVTAALAAVVSLVITVDRAQAAVTGVVGEAEVSITQYNGATPVQSDFSIEIIPQTKSEPPAIARARLDRLLSANEVIAAGQGVAIMYAPNLSGAGNPNDVGIDVGAFSDSSDLTSSWLATGTVKQSRSFLVSPGELGLSPGASSARVRNRLLLSGIMIVSSESISRDLTGVDIHFAFHLIHRQSGRATTTPLSGEIALVGGPGGAVNVERRAGALNDIVIPIIDLNAAIPSSPLVKAIVFDGVVLQYEYDTTLNQPYDLDLAVTATVATIPGGVGGLATFGTPPEGLAAIFDRVKQDDSGPQLNAAIAHHVDTTGESYVNKPVTLPGLSPMCGTMGASLMSVMLVGAWVSAARHGRRRATSKLG